MTVSWRLLECHVTGHEEGSSALRLTVLVYHPVITHVCHSTCRLEVIKLNHPLFLKGLFLFIYLVKARAQLSRSWTTIHTDHLLTTDDGIQSQTNAEMDSPADL